MVGLPLWAHNCWLLFFLLFPVRWAWINLTPRISWDKIVIKYSSVSVGWWRNYDYSQGLNDSGIVCKTLIHSLTQLQFDGEQRYTHTCSEFSIECRDCVCAMQPLFQFSEKSFLVNMKRPEIKPFRAKLLPNRFERFFFTLSPLSWKQHDECHDFRPFINEIACEPSDGSYRYSEIGANCRHLCKN